MSYSHKHYNIHRVSLISIPNTNVVAALQPGHLPSVGNSYSGFPAFMQYSDLQLVIRAVNFGKYFWTLD